MALSFKKHPSLTKQSFKDECDANIIMSRWAAGGELTHISRVLPRYGDFSSVADYQTSLNVVLAMEEAFHSLPAKVRDRFGHDPAELLAFVADEANRAEAIELGLIDKPAEAVSDSSLQSPTPQGEPASPGPDSAGETSST